MMDDSQQNWVRLLNTARENASQELHFSNEILSVIDLINQLANENKIPQLEATKITTNLMSIALKLAEQSKQISVSVWKLVGEL